MRVELFPPDSVTEPRHWVRYDQAFAMMLRPGSIAAPGDMGQVCSWH
jgi:AraC family transcriptional regulator